MDSELRLALNAQAAGVAPLPSPSPLPLPPDDGPASGTRLVVADACADSPSDSSALIDPARKDPSHHCATVAYLARDLGCPPGGACAANIASVNAMLDTSLANIPVGKLGDLASALFIAVDTWKTDI